MALTRIQSIGIATGISLTGVTTTQDAKIGTGITLSPDGDVYATGIITATSYRGDVSSCTGVGQTNFIDAETINVSGITTLNSTKVGTGITLSPDGDVYATGVSTFSGAITANSTLYVGSDLTITDKIVHNGDTNTAIRFPAADTITFETGASERLRITSTGALGTNSTVRAAAGGLDIQAQGATDLGTLTLGASGGANGQARSANAENQFRIMTPTYADPAKMFTVMYGASGSSTHEVNLGGGTGWAYAANTLRFFTAANQTTGTGSERLRIASDGEVFIGPAASAITDRSTLLSVTGTNQDPTGVWTQVGLYSNDSQAADKGGSIGFGGQDGSSAKQQFSAIKGAKENATSGNYAGYMAFYTRPAGAVTSERLRIDSGGRILIGATASQDVYTTSTLQIQGTTAATTTMSLLGQGRSPYLSLGATGGSSLGAVNAVSSGDRLGQLTFAGADGTDVNTHSCSVSGYCDGSVSSNAVPGRLVFKTSTGASESERLRINSAGNIMTGALSEPLGFGYHSTTGTTLTIYDANANGGILEVGGNPYLSGYNAGSIAFMNNNNSNGSTPWNANSKFVALIRAQLVTSDNNAGDDSGADLVFYRKPEAGAGTSGMKIKSTGDVEVTDGNLVIGTAAHGIDFSVTGHAGGMTTELLDNYEEGTWTATYYPTSSGFSASSYNLSAASYTRIGNIVNFSFRIRLASASGGGGSLQIAGFPYTFKNGQPQSIGRCWGEGWTSNIPQVINADASSRAMLYWRTSSTGALATSNRNDLNNGNSYLICTGTYQTD